MKIKENFFELTGELDKKYFPEIKYYRDDTRATAVHFACELFNNGCMTYRKFITTLGFNCGDNMENIHNIVSNYIEDFGDFKWHPRTIDKIITHVGYSMRGAPMGRYSDPIDKKPKDTKVFDSAVPMSSDGAYDKGGAYWGTGKQLRVQYTKDLTYVHFYRKGEE